MDKHTFAPVTLRAYDIRGIVGETLFPQDAYALGRSFASLMKEEKRERIAVGFDGRISSPELSQALQQGLFDSGCEVVQVGLGPTPLLYFAVASLQLDAGIMVTGSHNPAHYNGFKLCLREGPFFGDDIQELARWAAAGKWVEKKPGKVTAVDLREVYIDTLCAATEITSSLKVAWDPGNGATGDIVRKLTAALPGQHLIINADIDGTFPAHHPDPTAPHNLRQLIDLVKTENCDLGFAFDGDGDRLGVVDHTGQIVWGDQILTLLAESLLKSHPGAEIIGDIKVSDAFVEAVQMRGGKATLIQTGHSFIKAKMKETGALLAGEMSGHFFIKDRYYGYDDGLYAAVRVLEVMSKASDSLHNQLKKLPQKFSTPEIRLPCEESEKFALVDKVKSFILNQGYECLTIDGVRVKSPQGWWLLRASNTEAILVLRCEGNSSQELEEVKSQAEETLRICGIKGETFFGEAPIHKYGETLLERAALSSPIF